jgi:hypothetical protein
LAGWAALAAACFVAAGCGPAAGPRAASGARPADVDRVDALSLWATPAAVTLGESERPNGVGVRLYMYQAKAGKVLPVAGKGEVRIDMYDGALRGESLAAAKPLHAWKFSGADIRPFLGRDSFGLSCYEMALRWGQDVPTAPAVTLVARYQSAGLPEAVSSPTVVSIRVK